MTPVELAVLAISGFALIILTAKACAWFDTWLSRRADVARERERAALLRRAAAAEHNPVPVVERLDEMMSLETRIEPDALSTRPRGQESMVSEIMISADWRPPDFVVSVIGMELPASPGGNRWEPDPPGVAYRKIEEIPVNPDSRKIVT